MLEQTRQYAVLVFLFTCCEGIKGDFSQYSYTCLILVTSPACSVSIFGMILCACLLY